MYHREDGSAQPIIRMHTKVLATMEQLAHLEAVLGDYGGQLSSFEWVFSPRGPDGGPLEMFNRATGAVDPKVVEYWGEHFHIAHQIETHWTSLARIFAARFISLWAPTIPFIWMVLHTACKPYWIACTGRRSSTFFPGEHISTCIRTVMMETRF